MTLKMADDSKDCNETAETLQNGISHSDDDLEIGEVGDIDTIVPECSKEYADLDNKLDQLDKWMNTIEDQNDNLYGRIDELLQSNRQIRKELQEQNSQQQTKQEHGAEPMDQEDPKS